MSVTSHTSLDTVETKLIKDRELYLNSAGSILSVDPLDLPVNEDFPNKIKDRWSVSRILGAGAFGSVYEGADTVDGTPVAIKMANPYFEEELRNEAMLYSVLWSSEQKPEGIPQVFYSGSYEGREVMVMQYLGSSVKGWMGFCGGKMSLKSVFMIGIQMIDRLEHIHDCGILHCDIKPENMLIGRGDGKIVYVVDLGLSTAYVDAETGEHVPFEEDLPGFTGTADYASLNAHRRVTLSRRDDLESLAYSMVYIHTGRLPWFNVADPDAILQIERIGEAKLHENIFTMCTGMGMPMVNFMQCVYDLEFDQRPDYDHLRSLLRAGLDLIDTCHDNRFEWCSVLQK